jgi:uncharacterized protein
MTIVYFDSSAFVKLLVDEPGSDVAAALWDGCDAAVSSRLAYPEVRAALSAAHRAKRLTIAALRRAESAWDEFWAATRPVELSEEIARAAGALAGERTIGGAGAVHLASLLALGTDDALFAVWDERLRSGARATAFRVVPDTPGTPH